MSRFTASAGMAFGRAPEAARGTGRKRCIALLLESDGPGGAEYMLLHLAEELRRRGHDVLPVGPADRSGWLGDRLRERGFQPATFRLRGPLDLPCLLGLVRLFRRRGVDVVHSHEFALAVYGAAAARIAGASHVITMHGGRYWAERWRRRAVLRWAFRRSSGVVAVSRATRTDLVRTLAVGKDRIEVIPNGTPPPAGRGEAVREELGLGPDEPLVVAVGNLYPVKGHAVLLKALARLRRSDPELSWTLALAGRGRGREEERLRDSAEEWGIGDRVHFLGFRDDVGDLLAAAQIYAMPSLSEGLPLALLEAMHAGTAIVASEVGGIPEAVAAGQEALLVPPGDDGALAASLRSVLEDPGLRRRLAAAARVRARERFSVDVMADAYERLYGWEPRVTEARGDVPGWGRNQAVAGGGP